MKRQVEEQIWVYFLCIIHDDCSARLPDFDLHKPAAAPQYLWRKLFESSVCKRNQSPAPIYYEDKGKGPFYLLDKENKVRI